MRELIASLRIKSPIFGIAENQAPFTKGAKIRARINDALCCFLNASRLKGKPLWRVKFAPITAQVMDKSIRNFCSGKKFTVSVANDFTMQ